MKALALILIYVAVFMGVFFILSTIGLLWVDSYHQIISNMNWFMLYTLFVGWWVSMLVVVDLDESKVL